MAPSVALPMDIVEPPDPADEDGYAPVFYSPSGSAVASACNGSRNRVPRDGKSGRNPLFRTFVGTHNTLHNVAYSRLPPVFSVRAPPSF
jgi:hypothetical protein